MAKKKITADRKITLVVSEDKNPTLSVSPGMQVEVVAVTTLDSGKKAPVSLGTLCGLEPTYCVALVEV